MRVLAYGHPSDLLHEQYQAYYREGLRLDLQANGGRLEFVPMMNHATILRQTGRLRYSAPLRRYFGKGGRFTPWAESWARRIGGNERTPAGHYHHGVGQYVFVSSDGSRRNVCIDSCDYGTVPRHELAEWSDVYFKTNWWPSLGYPPRVVPLANCDPLVIPRIAQLRSLRGERCEYDICCVMRVWGGRDTIEGIEHNLRLLEAVAHAPGRKFIFAHLVAGDRSVLERHLRSLGVPFGKRLLPARRLWQATAASRLNIIRLGVHYCVPWRVTGALAIGSCIVLDRVPWSLWPEPLRAGEHFLDLGLDVGPERPIVADSAYAEATDRLREFLAQPELVGRVASAGAAYFDRVLEPRAVGRYLVDRVAADDPDRPRAPV